MFFNLTVLYSRTGCRTGLEKLESGIFKKRLEKLEKYMVFDSERPEKLDSFQEQINDRSYDYYSLLVT